VYQLELQAYQTTFPNFEYDPPIFVFVEIRTNMKTTTATSSTFAFDQGEQCVVTPKLCNVLVGYIETIRVDNIVQICTNNALNIRNVTNILVHHFSNFYFQSCVIHCLDLLLEGWGEATWVKQIAKKTYIYIFHMATPCTISNLSSLVDKFNALKPQ
jgi:hypothetical protein